MHDSEVAVATWLMQVSRVQGVQTRVRRATRFFPAPQNPSGSECMKAAGPVFGEREPRAETRRSPRTCLGHLDPEEPVGTVTAQFATPRKNACFGSVKTGGPLKLMSGDTTTARFYVGAMIPITRSMGAK